MVTLLRFGKWKEILAEPAPDQSLQLDTAMWLYAQAFAHGEHRRPQGRPGRPREARGPAEDRLRHATTAFDVPVRADDPGRPWPRSTARSRASPATCRAPSPASSKAQELERALPYTEPAYWHRPVAHLLGAALLEAGKPAEAEAVYRDSLHHYRRDGWALTGLGQALTGAGQDGRGGRRWTPSSARPGGAPDTQITTRSRL